MEYIRLIHPRLYDHTRKCFNDLAFKKSSGGGGMSVVEVECAANTSRVICDHLNSFYSGVGGEPPVFCRFSDRELPVGTEILSTPSDSGDLCHREVHNVSNNALKKMRYRTLENFSICDLYGSRSVTEADVASWKSAYSG